MQITDLEKRLLKQIMDSEVDGYGMGYSEYNGKNIDNKTKGVLSSLIHKNLVYDSMATWNDEHDYTPMYCTNLSEEQIKFLEKQ